MQTSSTVLRDAFWASLPLLPASLSIEREEPIVVTRVGRSGAAVYDLLRLRGTSTDLQLVAAYQTRLLARHVAKLKQQLESIAEQRRARTHRASLIIPSIITDAATPSVIEECGKHSVALFDQRGTCVINAPGFVVYKVGKLPVERQQRIRLFGGRASRIVRYLLSRTALEGAQIGAKALAAACELSYAYTYSVLVALEREGFVGRRSPRSGFRVSNAVGLLRAWLKSGEKASITAEAFYCPTTRSSALTDAHHSLTRTSKLHPLFTLAGALEPEDVHVSALPYGLYWTGETQAVVEAFGLKRATPHNFLILRPDPVVWTDAGGLLLTHGPDVTAVPSRVGLPQLAADFATLPGRSKDQANFLVDIYARQLPYHLDDA